MRNLISWCPETRQPVNLQIYTDYVTLALIWSNPVRFECPHCSAKHETKVERSADNYRRNHSHMKRGHQSRRKHDKNRWRGDGSGPPAM
jgi:hypothetical protein